MYSALTAVILVLHLLFILWIVLGVTVTVAARRTGISGSLTQTTKVTFGSVAATVFTVNSDTQVRATVPSGAVTGKIAIATPGGTATSATSFTVI